MLATIIITSVLGAVAFFVLRKKTNGKEMTREELAVDVGKFIDGSATPLDWDDFVTFSLEDRELETMRRECLDVLLGKHTKKEKPWVDDEVVAVLTSVVARLKKKPNQSPEPMPLTRHGSS